MDKVIRIHNGTLVRVWVCRKKWHPHDRGWKQQAPQKVFDGTFGELCTQYPPDRSAFEPVDGNQVRIAYRFEVLTPNHGWMKMGDPRRATPVSS